MQLARLYMPSLLCLALALAPLRAPAMIILGGDAGGYVRDVAVAGDLAFLASWWGDLRIVDVSDPRATLELGRLKIPGLDVRAVAADGTFVYVNFRNAQGPPSGEPPATPGLRIFDVSDPANPAVIGTLELSDVSGLGPLNVSDGIALLGSHILDVSDPTAPVQLGTLPVTRITSVRVVGKLAYVARGYFGGETTGLRIFDVSNPSTPVELGRLDLDIEGAFDLNVVDEVAYVFDLALTNGPSYVYSIDVSNPAAPTLLGSLPVSDPPSGLAVRSGRAFVTSLSGLYAIDISDPTALVNLGELASDGFGAIMLAGNIAYVGGRDGLRIIDVSKPEWPVRVGTLSDSNTGRVAVQESLAYISGYSNLSNRQGLQVVDVSNPMAPTEVGWLDGSTSSDVVLDGSLAYVPGEWASGLLRIVDISNPTAPVEIGLMLAPGRISAVAIKGTLAYLAYVAYGPTSASGGLQIVDVSDPAAPVERARFPTARPARAVDVLGGIAYLGVPGFGALPSRLLVIDVSDPSAPLEIANVPIDVAVNRPESAYLPELAADRNWLYAPVNGSWDTALAIFDISNPAAPTQQAFDLDEITSVADMALDGDRLYLADAFGAVNVFDVSNPNAIAALGALAIPSGRPGRFGTDSIALGNGLVHAVQWRSGLTIVDFGPEYASARRVTLDVKPGSERNPLELVSRGVIPAAILGAPDLDVTQIDATSLRFGPGEAAPIHPSGGHTADVNGDGLPDLLSHYRTQEMDIAYGDTEVCVRGATVDGVRLEGCDHIDTQPGAGTRRSR